MARKGKSWEEIWQQRQRLIFNPNISDTRAQRVVDTASRYRNNISNTRTFASDIKNGKGLYGASRRVYPRATYMGLAGSKG